MCINKCGDTPPHNEEGEEIPKNTFTVGHLKNNSELAEQVLGRVVPPHMRDKYLRHLTTHNQGEKTLVARLEVPSDQKIIFISDIHFEGDINTTNFTQSLLSLAEIYPEATFVINGDLFNGIYDINGVISGFGSELLGLFAKLNVIYVSGDHDGTTAFSERHQDSTERYFTEENAKKLFPNHKCFTDVLILDVRRPDGSVSTFYIEHHPAENRHKETQNKFIHNILRKAEENLLKHGGPKNREIPLKFFRISARIHQSVLKWAEKYLEPGVYIMTGHSHALRLNGLVDLGSLHSSTGEGTITILDPKSMRISQYYCIRKSKPRSTTSGYYGKSVQIPVGTINMEP